MTASQKPRRTDEELWAELCALPEHVTGQIIDGELLVQPRPRPRHARVIKRLGRFLSPTDDGDGIEGGQGGWWILIEPGIELPGAPEIVPDLAGWRRSTLPEMDLDAPLRSCPAWACEVRSLQVFRSTEEGLWLLRPTYSDEAAVRVPPFEEVELPLTKLWL